MIGSFVQVSIAGTDLALSRGNVDQALALLQAIGPDQNYYVEARQRMASIYLEYRKDTKLFITCYRYRRTFPSLPNRR